MTILKDLEMMRQDLHQIVCAMAREDYLRRGHVPRQVMELVETTRSFDALAKKYKPDQPRAPSGSPDGGQWIDAGGSATTQNPNEETPTEKPEVSKPDADKKYPNEEMRNFLAEAEQPDVESMEDRGYGNFNGTLDSNNVALGRYQLRNQGLVDVGLKKPDGTWRRDTAFYQTHRITSDKGFLKNPTAQEDAMTLYMARQEKLSQPLYREYGGYTYTGIARQKITVTTIPIHAIAGIMNLSF